MKLLITLLSVLVSFSLSAKGESFFNDPRATYLYGPDDFFSETHQSDFWITGNKTPEGIHSAGMGTALKVSKQTPPEGLPYFPSLDKGKSFSVAMTFAADSIQSSSNKFDLFSGLFRTNREDTEGTNMNISYDTSKGVFESQIDGVPGVPPQLTAPLPAGQDLTIIINQTGDYVFDSPSTGAIPNNLSVSIYSGLTCLGTINFGSLSVSNGFLYDFYLGSESTSLTLKGMGVIVHGSLADEDGRELMEDYFKKVGVMSVPEPSTALLALLGCGLTLIRRRKDNAA